MNLVPIGIISVTVNIYTTKNCTFLNWLIVWTPIMPLSNNTHQNTSGPRPTAKTRKEECAASPWSSSSPAPSVLNRSSRTEHKTKKGKRERVCESNSSSSSSALSSTSSSASSSTSPEHDAIHKKKRKIIKRLPPKGKRKGKNKDSEPVNKLMRWRIGARSEDCIVEMRTTQSVKFRTLCETLSPLLVDGNLVFNEDGIFLSEMANSTMINLSITMAEHYICKEPITCGVNFEIMHKVLKGVTQEDIIVIQITKRSIEESIPEMHIYIVSDDGCVRNALKLMTLQEMYYEPPAKTFDTIVTMDASEFQKILRCHHKSGDHIQMLCKADTGEMYFITNGDDYDCFTKRGTTIGGDEDENMMTKNIDSDKHEIYPLRSLMLIAKATNLSTSIRIFLSDNYPLVLKYNIGTLGQITFILAANIEDSNISLGSDKLEDLIAVTEPCSEDGEHASDKEEEEDK